MTPIDTSTSKAAAPSKTTSPQSPLSSTPTASAASPPQTDTIKPGNNEQTDYSFYMDNSPRQDSKAAAKNSELAGDDDDEDGDDDEATTSTAFPNNNNNNSRSTSNSSLATVAENAIEKLVGIAMLVPDALIAADNNSDTDEYDHHRLEHGESEVYLEDNELEEKAHATAVRQQEQPAQPTNQTDTTLLKESLSTTTTSITTTAAAEEEVTRDESGDIPNSPATSSSASSIISTETTSSSDSQTIGASKDILTEGQAFAYVGLCLVTSNTLFQALEGNENAHAKQSLESFVSKLINRLYKHLDIDANTQRTIAQLPQMMLQPEDLLESFVADGTQRVVSSQQVDQAGLSISRSSTPTPSLHSRSRSSSSLNSMLSTQQSQQTLQEATSGTPIVRQGSNTNIASATSTSSVASLPRESISSLMSESSLCATLQDKLSTEPTIMEENQTAESPITTLSGSTTPMDESLFTSVTTTTARVSTSSQKAITVDLRWTLIADLFLISISDSVYDSRARVLLKAIGKHLGLDWEEIVLFEKGIMKQLQQQTSTNDGLLKPDTKSRNDESRKRRMIMMGLATVGGGLVLGLSAGLFAPVIGAGIGAALAGAHITGATVTAASAFLAGSGGIAVITSGAAVTGSGLAMKKMARRTAGIDTFEFLTIQDHKRVNVILTISGWLDIGDEDASLPFSTLDPINGDHYALFWEPEMLMQLGNALGLLATEVITLTAQEILKHTLLQALLSALAWPMALTRLGYLIDNPWSIALDRAKLAGLVGYSLGARVIFYCLLELGRLDAFGIVEDAYLFGAPITASDSQWRQARSAVAGDFVNGYLRNDWVLGFLFRATTGGLGTVAGLRPIKNVPGLTNMDLTTHVEGHLDYRVKIPILMKLIGLKITSESFLDKEEAILHQRTLKINPNETLKAPKPMMPSKAELAKSGALTENEKMQLEVAFRRQAPKAKIPDLDSIKGLTLEEKEALREALMSAQAAQGPLSPTEETSFRRR
ncbi:hypothetical protein BGZ96_000395 [Linnemannia gamsii]|uniref:DUF726-domain-containing protein n=1 Tax=Linnemannia gamsii TaxID=64522 RepID=A0ABQ7KAW0_9FUNG|nr:hypothetical protein BGZ96_000395 [Linnemannia gamsii]